MLPAPRPKPFARYFSTALLSIASLLLCSCPAGNTKPDAPASALPLPSNLPLNDYLSQLYPWLMQQQYKQLDWHHDQGVRDTGPYIRNEYFGTHPAVRVYYSPAIMRWLQNGRNGEIADGAMIIKEMYTPPAVLYQELATSAEYQQNPAAYEQLLGQLVTAWTVMIKDSQASKDGWFWAGPGAPQQGESIKAAVQRQLDSHFTSAPESGFGLPCLRCHASASQELTFSTLRNLNGDDSDEYPLRFLVDNSWRRAAHFADYPLSLIADTPYAQQQFEIPALQRPWPAAQPAVDAQPSREHMGHDLTDDPLTTLEALAQPNPAFLQQFPWLADASDRHPRAFPSQWADHVVPGPEGAQAFITSDNCLGCHGGLGGLPYGLTMFLQTGANYGDGFNLSEYGEWRWSPMGLAGRDPIFHAQLESEMAYLVADGKQTPSPLQASVKETQQALTNTCLSCHGGMGQRQLAIDAASNQQLDANFNVDYFYLTERLSANEAEPADYAYHQYGALAREGISCAMCHRITAPDAETIAQWQPTATDWLTPQTPKALAYALFHNSTGQFERGPNSVFYGPYADVAERPMLHTLGSKPVHNAFVQDSLMCGSCHTINLPNIGMVDDAFPVLSTAPTNPAFANYPHTIEQATFLEWQNSRFAEPGDDFASCQDCHMPGGFKSLDGDIEIDQLVTQIAAIQDANYPAAEETLPLAEITIALRDDYRRHEHVGLNVFLLEMFDQFPDILGVAKTDYMTSANNGVDLAIDNMIRQAQQDTAELRINRLSRQGNQLEASITVRNKAGHRLPSGVAFRRAFIDFQVLADDEVIWHSGNTNTVGVIVDGDGKPLATEMLPNAQTYQPHYQVITEQNQVQIYEELNLDANQQFTTSFVHRVTSVKDNRLLPQGWRESSWFAEQGEVMTQFMAATDPHGVKTDPDYADQGADFKGEDSLLYRITLPNDSAGKTLSVKATLYYQSIPPYWLAQRFRAAPNGLATQRLYYLTSRLNLDGTAMANWKLKLVEASASLDPVRAD